MGIWQLNIEAYHCRRDPNHPDQEPIPPPIFRPATLLFPNEMEPQDSGSPGRPSQQALRADFGRIGGLQAGILADAETRRTLADVTFMATSSFMAYHVLKPIAQAKPVHAIGATLGLAAAMFLHSVRH
ncbi:hypothetical protein M406DRAFT_71807 [Cryphonectria parasitica EP155]|uniref:Uncharacterized protein n=1 Tax=Cryphonectria parasitica (strain ATCC 38755 / EP155) TaxID=660469 RepID=A0A9P4Y8C0_CRYP1|nr:uncharacterized protein M406DRAFT_71807 [Cryphonectria parasitica EP155]KAF3768834.1 hypothetical protein M406DRAFT_71807 [Cryphonectria parasitica EP155]